MVFDTLFGQDSLYRTSPQMLEGVLVEGDGKRWTLTLRKGLKFHDGEPVLARDCVASVRRWGQRHPFGQELMRSTDELSTADDRTIVYQKGAYVLFRLRELLGDRPFWAGIRHYTRRYFGKSVTSRDFQTAMEESSGRSLSEFFAEWVY